MSSKHSEALSETAVSRKARSCMLAKRCRPPSLEPWLCHCQRSKSLNQCRLNALSLSLFCSFEITQKKVGYVSFRASGYSVDLEPFSSSAFFNQAVSRVDTSLDNSISRVANQISEFGNRLLIPEIREVSSWAPKFCNNPDPRFFDDFSQIFHPEFQAARRWLLCAS